MLPRIFIGGTGRSGTWILYNALGSHEAVHTFPAELRFLVDPDGLMDLVDSLTYRYSPVRAREALFRFERLMRVHLASPGVRPYAALDLPSWLDPKYYWQRLDEFCDTLSEVEYSGRSWNAEDPKQGRLITFAQQVREFRLRLQHRHSSYQPTLPRTCLKVGRYFAERAELVGMAAAFVDDLLLHAARNHGKATWCEKTPQHLLHLDFIWELFPDAVFIHIKRDPRGVVHSLTKQKWAPSDLKGACLFLKAMYCRWFELRPMLDLRRHHYLELTLEELAASPESALAMITEFCALENRFSNLPKLNNERVNYWQEAMSAQEIDLVNEILGSCIQEMGYTL